MATYAVNTPPHAGGQVPLVAPGGLTGDLAPTGANIALLVMNGVTATSITITTLSFDGLPGAVRTIVIPASQLTVIPLPAGIYGAGTVGITYANVTTLTGGATGVAVLTIPST